ncbi:AAA-ATPase At3g50940 [Beta vulgaris subsp. vulgaris]|uniref:AAA-ATPase At3g50940 n=1 Tax=Beta vulgaris subsp. vulgaris TaxID=3555 RepID=UPI00203676B1|nr:AAA-ATPase At3g50940 [Beta vulgaris subsp. vulgaris]
MENQFNIPSIFAIYCSLTACKQFYYQLAPEPIRAYIDEKIKKWFSKQITLDPKTFTLVIRQYIGNNTYDDCINEVFNACEAYLSNTLRSLSTRLEGCRRCSAEPVSYYLAQGEEYIEYVRLNDENDNVKLKWKFTCRNDKGEEDDSGSKKSFELSFDPRYKDMVLDSFLPLVVIKSYDYLIDMKKEIFLHTFTAMPSRYHWDRVSFNHPFTFDALALDPELKKSILDDLDMFLRRKEFYKKIGRAWKRGYLLYGPPGTGKSSLIAAIANYLKFNIYDLQLASIDNDSTLRKLMISISNKSILVIEDIDCASGLSGKNAASTREYDYYLGDSDHDDDNYEYNHDANHEVAAPNKKSEQTLSLSGLLNFVDGLWSSCGDERIIILTTNYKERLDPALLRPGRMDMHIHMSYLRMPGFRILASNYLGITEEHSLFEKIEELLETTDVSPAEAAEELIRSDDPDIALAGVVKMLQQKKLDQQVSEKKRKKQMKCKKGRKKAMMRKHKDVGEVTTLEGEC